MRKISKKAAGLILAVILCFSFLPVPVAAANDAAPGKTTQPIEAPAATEVPVLTAEPSPEPAMEPASAPTTEPTVEPVQEPTAEMPITTVVQPELLKVVDEPLVKVEYRYYDEALNQSATDFDSYTAESAHSFYVMAAASDEHITIPANRVPGVVPVNTDTSRFRVLLNDSEDITALAAYDAATGLVSLPDEYMGHKVTVVWYCPTSEIMELPVKVTVGVYRNGVFTTEAHDLSVPSNASMISVPVSASDGVVVSQNGIDLATDKFGVADGMLHISASALGGDIAVSAYVPAGRMTRGTTTRVNHTRSVSQIFYGYYTSYYTANGNTAFCLDPNLSGVATGTYDVSGYIQPGTGYDLLIKCAYYLYGGPGYNSVKNNLFGNPDSLEEGYGLSHAAAAYVWLNDPVAFQGLSSATIGHLQNVIAAVNAQAMPPAGFEVFLYNVGNTSNQSLMSWEYAPTGNLEIVKASNTPAMTDSNPCYSLEGAVFDVYDGGGSKVGSITTDANGHGRLDGLPAGSGYYIVETKAPKGYAITGGKTPVTITAGQTATVKVTNTAQGDPVSILLKKRDAGRNTAEPQGGGTMAGALFTIKFYKGHYTAAQLQDKTPTRSWVVRTDDDGLAMLHPDYLVSGNALYYDSSGKIPALPLGTVTIQETQPPVGYLINSELFVRQIKTDGSTEPVFTYNEPIVDESVIRGGISVEKWDFELNRNAVPQGDATLAGAVLEIYNRNANSVVVNGAAYAPGAVVHTMTTDSMGVATTANDLLPYGAYEIIEKTPPTGYLGIGVVKQTFNITTHGTIVSLTTSDTAIKNNPVRGGVSIEKWDYELNRRAVPQGDASLAGAVLEIYNRSSSVVVVGGTEYAPGAVVHTMITDATGAASTANDLLPYGSYEIIEKTPPTGYLSTGVIRQPFSITSHGVIVSLKTSATTIKNNVIRGGVEVEKWDNERNARTLKQGDATLAGAVLEIYSRNPNPIIVGGKEYAPNQVVHTMTTNADGWAGTANDLLPYGSYEIIEKTPPTGYLGTGIVKQTFNITTHGTIVSLTTSDTAIKNNPVRGGVSIEKWDYELNRRAVPQGDASLAGAVLEIYNRSASVVLVGGTEYAPGAVVHTMITDSTGAASTANDLLPYGSYEIIEKTPPTGYLSTGVIRQLFSITGHGVIVSLKTSATTIKNNVIRGGVEVEKWDIERNERTLKQGDATLAGAVLEIYSRNPNPVIVGGKEYAPNQVVHTMTTDADGWAGTANNLLPYGSYEVIEKTPPTGYLNAGVIRQSFHIRENRGIVSLTAADKVIRNDMIRGGVRVEKWDHEIDEYRPQGGATFEGAVFEIVNRSADVVLVQGNLYGIGEVVYTMSTDATGMALTPGDLLPYGTYEVREISPPGGYLATGVLSREFRIREHGRIVELDSSGTAIKNNPIRGDLKGVKISDGDAKRLANVPFSITSKTTGESHVIVTDRNGEFSTASSWNLHSRNTNRGETDLDGVWFGETRVLDDGLGALLYDTYILEELPCESNVGYELLKFEVAVYRHDTVVDLGTLTDDHIPVPEIFTTAMDKESLSNEAYVSKNTVIMDTIYYGGLKGGGTYTARGVLIDAATGQPVILGGEAVTSEKTFRAASGPGGSVTVEFSFDSTGLAGKSVVVFESLEYEGDKIAAHEDILDKGQTITFKHPGLSTAASGADGTKILEVRTKVKLLDTVAYDSLIPGEAYTLRGILMDKGTGEPLIIDGEEVTAEKSFRPLTGSGSVRMEFVFDSIALTEKTVVVFESLEHKGRRIASHEDLEDARQTVTFKAPKIGTSAAGADGGKELDIASEVALVDTVSYEDLTPHQAYTLTGRLMDKGTGKPLMIGGKGVTAKTEFKPEESSGTVEVAFTFNSAGLIGKTVVVFETLECGGTVIASHEDIKDAEQTVTFKEPKIGTSAADADGGKELDIASEVALVDTVS